MPLIRNDQILKDMKINALIPTALLPVFLLGFGPVYASMPGSAFEGEWKGTEKCKNVGAPVATVTVTADKDQTVVITGLYSTVGKIKGTIKGDVITIPQQTIPDVVFTNFKIEGTLTLSRNHQSLNAVFTVKNNDARDQCSAVYTH